MANGLPKEIADFMARYGVLASEIWPVRNGVYAIMHKALERVAVAQGIKFGLPTILSIGMPDKYAAVLVQGSMGDKSDWSTGEAAPYNNKNMYPLAMAEKRARDRVTLKLLTTHGALYSEDEADDFKRPNPHVTTPADVSDATIDYNDHGEPVDNIPLGDPGITALPKKDARKDYEMAQKEMRQTKTLRELEQWAAANANRIQSYPSDWAEIFRKLYAEHRDELRAAREAAQ